MDQEDFIGATSGCRGRLGVDKALSLNNQKELAMGKQSRQNALTPGFSSQQRKLAMGKHSRQNSLTPVFAWVLISTKKASNGKAQHAVLWSLRWVQ